MPTHWLKFILSFFKKDWNFRDYPVIVQKSEDAPPFAKHSPEPKEWSAVINGWHLIGEGDSREAALADLEEAFQRYKETNESLPRPGIRVPAPRALSDLIYRHGSLANAFMQDIFGLSPGDYFISNRSTLDDFGTLEGLSPREYQRKIALVYRVDVTDIEDGNIAAILERISQEKEGKHD